MSTAAAHAATLAGEPVLLCGDRALYWPARRRLLLSDLHLGKADTFRRAGIALPSGGTVQDLDRLTALAAATGATEAWILGDVLHGPLRDTHWRGRFDAWRAANASLRLVALSGNHDRALAGAGLDVELAGTSVDDGPFALRHAPESHPWLHVVCGHIHPVARFHALPRRQFPVFWLRAGCMVLPAFSEFTGGFAVDRADDARRFACVEGHVVPLDGP